MSIEAVFGIADSALTAQSQRITLIAQNLANADSVQSPEGGPYQRRVPIFEASPLDAGGVPGAMGVHVAAVQRDAATPRAVYDPSNPYADADGIVEEPAVNPVTEVVDMMQAARSYQANLSIVETARTAALKTLDLLK